MSNRVEVDIPSDIEDDDDVRRPLLKGAQTSHVSINDDTPRRSANHNADATWRQISRQQSNESLRSLAFTPDVYLTEDRIPEITLSWHHINVWTAARSGSKSGTCGKQILRNVSGAVQPRTLLAIMGASGAGKTTLLNVLTCRSRGGVTVEGDVRVNGSAIGTGMASVSAYIQQEDIFVGTLTVKEHLWFQAQLRMNKSVPAEIRRSRIEAVLTEMNLKKAEDAFIGIPGKLKGISGGEKKRLAFAAEVLTNPPIMFCDEPTSGLDSFMAQNLVKTMKRMAQKGMTILCTIHQPSSEVFELFDQLLLVAEGRVAYMGPAIEALNFFNDEGYPCPANFNPADHYIRTLAIKLAVKRENARENAEEQRKEQECRERVKRICDDYASSNQAIEMSQVLRDNERSEDGMLDECVFAHQSPYKATWFKQFAVVIWRSWKSMTREPGVFKTRLLQALILSLVFGFIFFNLGGSRKESKSVPCENVDKINGALYIMITQMTYNFVYNVINAFPPEFPVFRREHHDGMYRVDVYFLGKTMAETAQFILIPVIFGTIMYWLVALEPTPTSFFICLLTLVLVTNAAASFGYLMSCCNSSVALILALAPIFVTPFMSVGGFYTAGEVSKYLCWIEYTSWFTYSFRILLINQWLGVTNITCGPDDHWTFNNGSDVMKQRYHMTNVTTTDIWANVGYLLILVIGYRLLAFCFLLFRARKFNKMKRPKRDPGLGDSVSSTASTIVDPRSYFDDDYS